MTSPDTEFISILGATSGGGSEAPAERISSRSIPEVMPILGLSDIVIFPGMVAPLLVETAQSIHLIDDVVGGDRLLGVVLQRKPEAENPLPEDMYEIGCAARVLKMLKFPDNTVRVLVEGLWRIRIKEYETQLPYLRAKIELWKDIKEETFARHGRSGQNRRIEHGRPRASHRSHRGQFEFEPARAAADARNQFRQGTPRAAAPHAEP